MRIKVAIRDKVGKDFVIREVQAIKSEVDIDLERIARACEKIIRNTIMNKAKNPTGHLAATIYAEPIINGWAVGNIDVLDRMVPYWNHIDKGSEGIGANWQHYLPKGFWENGRWVENENGFSGIQPKSPIPAMNYISETLQKMEIEIPRILKG